LEGRDDLFDVLRPEEILRPALVILGVGVDKEHPPPALRRLSARRAQDEDASGDAGAVKEVGRQPDHRLQQVVLQDTAPDALLRAASEEDAVGHHRGHHPAGAGHRQHMLEEHQVSPLRPFRGIAVAEALFETHAVLAILLREGGIADDAVEAHQFTVLVQVLGIDQCVGVADVGVADAVEQEVHLADGPHAAVGVLPVERDVLRVAAGLLDVIAGEDEHAAGTDAGVVDAHPGLRLEQADHQSHHLAGGVELAALLARRVGKVLDQVLVGRAEHVGELEILVAQADAAEMLDQRPQRLVVEAGAAAHLAGETDVIEHALEGAVILLQRAQGFVELVADLLVHLVAQVGPAGAFRHVEGVGVVGFALGALAGLVLAAPVDRHLLLHDRLVAGLEDVGGALEEEHAKDVLLVFGGVHLAAQDVGRGEEVAFELG